MADAIDDDDDDDDDVDNIVNATNTSNISSISGNSNETNSISIGTMDTLPNEYSDGLYDATLFSGATYFHSYGTKPTFKKMFFNVYKFIKNRNTKNIVNIKVRDNIIYKYAMKCKNRFIFAGILCKYADYVKHQSNPTTTKLTSKFLV